MAEWDINMEKFENSLNFIFGLTGGDVSKDEFDILNNPYVRFVGLERTEGREFSEKYEFKICTDEYKERFIPEHAMEWYDQPLCFKNRGDVTIKNSWEYSEHAFPVITLAYCRNSTENADWCHKPEEIDEWLGNHVQYFVLQDTRVQSRIWEDDPIVSEFPYYGDEKNYFPTLRQMKE